MERQEMIDEFIQGTKKLHDKWIKRKYNRVKEALINLNLVLDKYDSERKNIEDSKREQITDEMEYIKTIVMDVFDNYRKADEVQIYSVEENKEIIAILLELNTYIKETWLESILIGMGIL